MGHRLSKIVKRTGDAGTTGLGDGSRVTKDSQRIEAIGEVDELNSTLGLLLSETLSEPCASVLMDVQHDLFDLGADLCVPETAKRSEGRLRVSDTQVERLEREIDSMNETLAPLNSFVLPGGVPAAAYLHLALTIVRRAERLMVELGEQEPVNPAAIRYANRLSDHLFVASRYINDKGAKDVLWTPGANR